MVQGEGPFFLACLHRKLQSYRQDFCSPGHRRGVKWLVVIIIDDLEEFDKFVYVS